MEEEKESEEYQNSFSVGTAGDTGAIKVYFNIDNLEETQLKLENMLKTIAFLRKHGYLINAGVGKKK